MATPSTEARSLYRCWQCLHVFPDTVPYTGKSRFFAACPRCHKRAGQIILVVLPPGVQPPDWERGVHRQSMELMTAFRAKHVAPGARVLDVGAYDVNGTFRPLFQDCEYVGLDVAPGPNVDCVVDPLDWSKAGQGHVVISGSTLEHVEDLYGWAHNVRRVCSEGGLICIVAPHTWPEHKHPHDCWRIFPDGMRYLFEKREGFETLECRADAFDTIYVGRG